LRLEKCGRISIGSVVGGGIGGLAGGYRDPKVRRDHNVRGTGGFASKVINIPIQILGEENQQTG
jgi:hypothetical protein